MGISRVRRPGGGARITANSRRIAAAGIAATALGLGLAVPARADDAAPAMPVPTAPADPTVAAPAAPDVSATVVQSGATNVSVSIRIGSAGDNTGITQTVSSGSATTTEDAPAQAAAGSPTAQTAASAAQAAPANIAVSVRVASPGSDGVLTQAIDANAAAATQYQPATTQYQPAPAPAGPARTAVQVSPPSATAPAAAPAVVPAAAAATAVPAFPTNWTWNWTWGCGDTTAAGITPVLDTGIQGWIWTWNVEGMCGPAVPVPVNSGSIISPQSVTDIPAVAAPVLPAPPVLPVIVAPTPPVIVAPTPPVIPAPPAPPVPAPAGAPILAVEAFLPVDDVTPAAAPLTPVSPDDLSGALLPPLPPPAPAVASGVPAWEAHPQALISVPVAAKRATPDKPRNGSEEPRRARQLVLLGVDAPAGGGGAASGGGSNGGPGGTAALAPWLLLSFFGYAALRLPAGRRAPRAPVEEIDVRPG